MRAAAIAILLATLIGCGGPELECIEPDLTCQPLYEPTFDNVFANTLLPKCGTEGSTCHSAAGRKAGLVLDDPDEAYRRLVDAGRVIPGDASCSLLLERVYAAASSLRMPPGRTLGDAERCALLQWVAAGAPR